jgi:hypothetical protein
LTRLLVGLACWVVVALLALTALVALMTRMA